MPNSTFFTQGCPTCGRRLEVRVEYLGKMLICRHCSGKFVAKDPCNAATQGSTEVADALLRRADEFLRCTAKRATQSHLPHPR